MSHKKVKLPWIQRVFYTFGTVFCITATCYFGMLLWKSYVWYKWLEAMEQSLIQQIPPTDGPLLPHDDRLLFNSVETDCNKLSVGVTLEEVKSYMMTPGKSSV